MELVLGWLLKQTPVIVVMGIVIYWLQNKLTQAEKENKELTKLMSESSKDLAQTLSALENLKNKLGEDSKEDATTKQLILQKLTEIKTMVSTLLFNEKKN
jgi:arsenate reductase-like glutaredoxin family protein